MTWISDLFKLGFPASIDFIAFKTLYLNSFSFIESLNSVLLKYYLAYAGFYFSTVLASIRGRCKRKAEEGKGRKTNLSPFSLSLSTHGFEGRLPAWSLNQLLLKAVSLIPKRILW